MDEVEGRIQFFVSITIDAAAMKEWSPDRIEAFFRGAAMIQSSVKGPSPQEEPEK